LDPILPPAEKPPLPLITFPFYISSKVYPHARGG
jgi:hypothetical protein